MPELLSFKNCELSKPKLQARMQRHLELDELRQGATGDRGKGCTVWCGLNTYDHALFPSILGLPEWLARLIDSIYERLSTEQSRKFHLDWVNAIPEGSDLSLIKNYFLEWLLIDPVQGVIRFSNHPCIFAVAELNRRVIEGKIVTHEEWAARAASETWAASAAIQAQKLLELLAAAPTYEQ